MTNMTFTLGGELPVYRLGYGALQFTSRWGWGMSTEPSTARGVLRRAVELGVNFIDTSDAYGPYTNEHLIADALHPYPDTLVIATKGGFEHPKPDIWIHNAHPQHLRSAVEGSLQRLRRDRIDLYQLHAPDPQVPLEESVGALADLQHEGKIRYIGLSNVTTSELEQAQRVAAIASVQNRYNIADRNSEDVLHRCEDAGIAFIPWHPLATAPKRKEHKLQRLAKQVDATPAQLVLAWLLHYSPNMLLIPGTSRMDHLEENVAAARLHMKQEDMEVLSSWIAH